MTSRGFMLLVWLGLGAFACAKPPAPTPAAPPPADAELAGETCTGLDEEGCAANLACAPLRGQALERGGSGDSCFAGDWSYLGCRPMPRQCLDGPVFACNEQGAFHLRDGCLPLGDAMHTCSDGLVATLYGTRSCTAGSHAVAAAPLAPAGEDACHGRDEASCRGDAACYAVRGARLHATDDGFACFRGDEYLGCRRRPAGCDDAITHVCHSSGETYRLGDTCVPTEPGFHDCGAADRLALHAPACNLGNGATAAAPPDFFDRVRSQCEGTCEGLDHPPNPAVHADPREACILQCIRDRLLSDDAG